MSLEQFTALQKQVESLLSNVEKLNEAFAKAQYPDYMPVKTAAKYLGLSASHLNKFRSYGGGPAFCNFGPKAVRYRRSELDAWASAHMCQHTAAKQAKTVK